MVPASRPPATAARHGRPSQRRRTRKAIVDAAIALIADGHTPSIDEIARAAEVSRRTIYMYFPTLDQLLIDATAGALSNPAIEAALDSAADSDDPAVRVETLARTMLDLAPASLPLGRQLIRLTVTAPENHQADSPTRGYRRIEWIERALQPLRERLDQEQFERLVSALAMIIGWEAMVVLRDIRSLDTDEETRTVTWAARALVDAMLTETNTGPDRGSVHAGAPTG
jgi:AcrR family transcriptional regulator